MSRSEAEADAYEADIAAEVEITWHDNRKPLGLRWHRNREAPRPGALPKGWSSLPDAEIAKLLDRPEEEGALARV